MDVARIEMRAGGRGVRYREQTRLARFSAPPLKCSVGRAFGVTAGGELE
jgi:hypothetical protein